MTAVIVDNGDGTATIFPDGDLQALEVEVQNHSHTDRDGPTSQWEAINPVLPLSQPGWDTTVKRWKVGDGVSRWNDLPYVDQALSDALTALITEETLARQADIAAVFAGVSKNLQPDVVATSNLTLSGLQTVDTVAGSVGLLVWCAAQTTAPQNGLWLMQSGPWTRPDSFAVGTDASGVVAYIKGGSNATAQYAVSGEGPIIIGTNSITIIEINRLGDVIVTAPLTKSGNTLAITVGTSSSSVAAGNDSRITGAVQTGSNPDTGVSVSPSGLLIVTGTTVHSALTQLDAAIGKPYAGGLTGATSATRWVGATASGAPASGTFLAGDWVIDLAAQVIRVCTAGGTPGTWAVGSMLANDDGTLGSPVTVTTSLTPVMSTNSLAVGTWLVEGGFCTNTNNVNADLTLVAGTATVSAITGKFTDSIAIAGGLSTTGFNIAAKVVITGAGTLTFKAKTASSTVSILAASTLGTAGVSGYIAEKVA